MKDIAKFLSELTNLSLKYELYICGCGCCGSPYIRDFDGDVIVEDLKFSFLEKSNDKITASYSATKTLD